MPGFQENKATFPFGWVALLVIVVVALAAVHWYEVSKPLSENAIVPQAVSGVVLLRGDEGSVWYKLSGNILTPISGPAISIPGNNTFSVAETSATLPIGTPVLVSPIIGSPPVLLGLVLPAGGATFPIDIDNTTEKKGLVVRSDGLAAFSYALGPDTSFSSWHIGVVDLAIASSSLKDLGQGYGPAFAANGNIIALSEEGLVEIDSQTSARITLLKLPNDFSSTFAIAPDTSFVVVKNLYTNVDDVFWINPANPMDMSYAGSLSTLPLALGILGNYFVAQTSATSAGLYSVSHLGIELVSTLTITTSP